MLFRMVYKSGQICSSVLSQSTRLTEGQTDKQTEFPSLDHVCILQRGKII